ncbi:hypothetical protein, partial [Enterobacter cloacae complex sp. CH23B]|uniref:hypothetical protein n=1 Tax=Enterobacter cloacae complex sp. CH23B TaxID=2511986 RepID=UPI001CA559A7
MVVTITFAKINNQVILPMCTIVIDLLSSIHACHFCTFILQTIRTMDDGVNDYIVLWVTILGLYLPLHFFSKVNKQMKHSIWLMGGKAFNALQPIFFHLG